MFIPNSDTDNLGPYTDSTYNSNRNHNTNNSTLGMRVPADAFAHCQSGQHSNSYGAPMAYDPSLYAETGSHYMMHQYPGNNSCGSPGMAPEDGDVGLGSSTLSTASAPSSTIGSPQSHQGHSMGPMADWTAHNPAGALQPAIVSVDYLPGHEYAPFGGHGMEDFALDFSSSDHKPLVDPCLIHPEMNGASVSIQQQQQQQHEHQQRQYEGYLHHSAAGFPISPSAASSPQINMFRHGSTSPYPPPHGPFPAAAMVQHLPQSLYGTTVDHGAHQSGITGMMSPTVEYHSGDETREKLRCTWPDCGKYFKDLKAHMLTHQNERPEKCPIQTCEYHIKGFARKYDKNRHTLTHYKGTMVCGFCPGSGTPAEKSFNRADVFKRHLMSVHAVEQTPPNSRKKTTSGAAAASKKLDGYAPDATGKCSTCSQTFDNAQDFYEHLDDCVLRVVQQEDPAEAINAQHLGGVESDEDVHATLEKNNLPVYTPSAMGSMGDEEDDECDMDGEEEQGGESVKKTSSASAFAKKKGNPVNGVQKSRGMTHSRGGVAGPAVKRGRRHRREYPSSWGFDQSQMTMRKRVLCVFDGPRRLAKDEMMLSTEHEVRLKLSDPNAYVTDLDVQTLKRAGAFHEATEEEKGPWISDDPTEEQLQEMRMGAALLEEP